MNYLISVQETYRVDTEEEVERLIEEAKRNGKYSLAKYTRAYKVKKQKGEIVEDWYRVTLTKEFNEEKEPDRFVEVTYES